METVLSTLRLMPDTKERQSIFSNDILNSVLDGDVPALEVDIMLKSLEETIKLVRKNQEFKEALSDELDLHTQKTIDLGNCTVTKASRATYQFNEDADVLSLESKVKARKELLKTASKDGVILIDPETGEQIEPVTIKHSEYTTIKFK